MVTHERLLEILNYDPETGIFTWRVRRGRLMPGSKAGCNLGGYVQIMIDEKHYLAHRLAWFYVHGAWPSLHIDHADTDKGNNRISNLREASIQQNSWNTAPKKGKTSKWKGVSFDKSNPYFPWKINFKLPDGGSVQRRFKDEREAAEEWIFLALEHRGEFARLQ